MVLESCRGTVLSKPARLPHPSTLLTGQPAGYMGVEQRRGRKGSLCLSQGQAHAGSSSLHLTRDASPRQGPCVQYMHPDLFGHIPTGKGLEHGIRQKAPHFRTSFPLFLLSKRSSLRLNQFRPFLQAAPISTNTDSEQ